MHPSVWGPLRSESDVASCKLWPTIPQRLLLWLSWYFRYYPQWVYSQLHFTTLPGCLLPTSTCSSNLNSLQPLSVLPQLPSLSKIQTWLRWKLYELLQTHIALILYTSPSTSSEVDEISKAPLWSLGLLGPALSPVPRAGLWCPTAEHLNLILIPGLGLTPVSIGPHFW